MRAGGLLLTALLTMPRSADAEQGDKAVVNLKGLKERRLPGFALIKRTVRAAGVVELWKRGADATQLRIEVVTGATVAVAEARLKAINATISTQGQQAEELLFRYETSRTTRGWTNYRGTHHITFKTYRCWKLRKATLVMADVSFLRGKPDANAARGAFVAAKKAADSTLEVLGLNG